MVLLDVFSIFIAHYIIFPIFPDDGGPRRSTRADYETAISATGIHVTYLVL